MLKDALPLGPDALLKIGHLCLHAGKAGALLELRVHEADGPGAPFAKDTIRQAVIEAVGVGHLEVLLGLLAISPRMDVIFLEDGMVGRELGQHLQLPVNVRLLPADEVGGTPDGSGYFGGRVGAIEKHVGDQGRELALGRLIGAHAGVLHLLLLEQEELAGEDALHERDRHQGILERGHHEAVPDQGLVEGLLVGDEVRGPPLADGAGLASVLHATFGGN